MMKFGIQSIKILCFLMTGVVLVIGICFAFLGSTHRSWWYNSQYDFGPIYRSNADFAFYFGIAIIFATGLGIVCISISNYALLIIYNIIMVVLAFIMLIYGLRLWMVVKSEHGTAMLQLRATMNSLTPMQLDDIQKSFKCCGIEKYTDYLMIWKMWGMNASDLYTKKTAMTRVPTEVNVEVKKNVNGKGKKEKKERKLSHSKKKSWKKVSFTETPKKNLRKEKVKEEEPIRIWKAVKSDSKSRKKDKFRSLHHAAGWRSYFDTIGNYIHDVWANVKQPLLEAAKLLYKKTVHVYKLITPYIIQRWVSLFVQYVRQVFRWFTKPVKSMLKWWFGSGWDHLVVYEISKVDVLPYSCCKNPTTRCEASHGNTWPDGCKSVITRFWRTSGFETALMLLCSFVPTIITAHAVYIYSNGVRQMYY